MCEGVCVWCGVCSCEFGEVEAVESGSVVNKDKADCTVRG